MGKGLTMGVEVEPGLRSMAVQRWYTGLRPLGAGLEPVVYEAVTVDTRALLAGSTR